jgi:hypothetical protein
LKTVQSPSFSVTAYCTMSSTPNCKGSYQRREKVPVRVLDFHRFSVGCA